MSDALFETPCGGGGPSPRRRLLRRALAGAAAAAARTLYDRMERARTARARALGGSTRGRADESGSGAPAPWAPESQGACIGWDIATDVAYALSSTEEP